MVRTVKWNECGAHARTLEEGTGRERQVICDLPKHCDTQDASEEHWDDKLGIYWRYADGADFEEER